MIIFWLWIGFMLYIIPTIIGFHRKKKSKWGLFVFNIFFGWTGIGWIAGLIWSLS